jgi:hypothetical protein
MSGLPPSPASNGVLRRLLTTASGAVVGTVFGTVVMLAGTFAPWLASGTSERNLYGSAGLVQRLAGLGQPAGLALDALPLTGLYAIAAGVAYVMGRRRIAAGAIALLAVVFAGIALAALSHRRSGDIRLLAVGPSVTLTGALLCLATLLVAVGQLQHRARVQRRTQPARPTTSSNPASSSAPVTDPLTDPMTNPSHPLTNPTHPSSGRPRTMEFR